MSIQWKQMKPTPSKSQYGKDEKYFLINYFVKLTVPLNCYVNWFHEIFLQHSFSLLVGTSFLNRMLSFSEKFLIDDTFLPKFPMQEAKYHLSGYGKNTLLGSHNHLLYLNLLSLTIKADPWDKGTGVQESTSWALKS